MTEQEQLLYMQARILQMAMERWHLSRESTVAIFRRYGIAAFVEDNFDLYHMGGDDYVFDDITAYLKAKGVTFDDCVGK